MLRSTHMPYDPKMPLLHGLPDPTFMLPPEYVVEGGNPKWGRDESWGKLGSYAMDRREHLHNLIRGIERDVRKLGGEFGDKENLSLLSSDKDEGEAGFPVDSPEDQVRLLKIKRIKLSHAIIHLDSFIQFEDTTLNTERELTSPFEHPVIFEYTEDVPENVQSLYYDCAPEFSRVYHVSISASYTVHGIKQFDSWFCRQIQAHRPCGGEGLKPRYTSEEIARMVRRCPHLHPVIKSNLLHNLKNYTGYKGWDTPEHVEEQVRARGPLYSVPALDSVYTGV